MLDPFPLPIIKPLASFVQPFADYFSLKTLPLHIHEVLCGFILYYSINVFVSPFISARLFPTIYPRFGKRTRVNWDVHVVSLVQSCLINTLALWVMWNDEERSEMNWKGRVWGYTGGSGMIQGLAAGYFLWDLIISIQHVDIHGVGMLAHAISALFVFSMGFVSFPAFHSKAFEPRKGDLWHLRLT